MKESLKNKYLTATPYLHSVGNTTVTFGHAMTRVYQRMLEVLKCFH
uniref:Uncharacterized protein n=1 Tax=Arundo donax TaxID=35708 RepID=A0A0A9A998_ARUDO